MPAPKSLRLAEYSDRELLAMVSDLQDADGWTNAHDLVKTLGVEHPNPLGCVSIRMSWLRRFGAVERDVKKGRWRLTPMGEVMVRGRLTTAQEAMLADIRPDQMLLLTRWIGRVQRDLNASNSTAGTLVRREWAYSTGAAR